MEFDCKENPSPWENFGMSGPIHLTSVNWGIADHRRSVGASLVQGVYILDIDRQLKRIGSKSLASDWWEFFHFECIQVLIDPLDNSIFGAIFYYKPRISIHHYYTLPPRYVVAFRGTLIKPDTRFRDFSLDVQLPLKGLPYDPSYHVAFQAVWGLISQVSHQNVWLTGHSLGAAIALQVGKDMAKKGIYIQTFLFNPPYNSAPIERLNNPYTKSKMRVAKSLLTAGLALAVKGNRESNNSPQKCDPFTKLCSWVPHIYVNPRDMISCEYIWYFEHRDRMEAWSMGKIENIATKNSVMNMFAGVFGRDGEPSHLVPSAFLVKNLIGVEQSLMDSHGIHQWWKSHPWQSIPQKKKIHGNLSVTYLQIATVIMIDLYYQTKYGGVRFVLCTTYPRSTGLFTLAQFKQSRRR